MSTALGAVSRASMKTSRLSEARCSKAMKPPPIPELCCSTTARVEDTATAASNALPPLASTSKPALVARKLALAMAAWPGPREAAGTSCAAAWPAPATRNRLAATTRHDGAWVMGFLFDGISLPVRLTDDARKGLQRGLRHEVFVLEHQLFAGFHVVRVVRDALHRTYLDALGIIEVADAFGAEVRIDHVVLLAQGDGLVGADGLADVAVDAGVEDKQGHDVILSRFPSRHAECLRLPRTLP